MVALWTAAVLWLVLSSLLPSDAADRVPGHEEHAHGLGALGPAQLRQLRPRIRRLLRQEETPETQEPSL